MPDSRSGDAGSKASKKLIVPPGALDPSLASIIIVTGTPGVGKSTLARFLARSLNLDFVELNDLVKKESLYSSFDKKRKSYVVNERKLRKRLEEMLKATAGYVIATHLIGKFFPKRSVRLVLVLRLDPLVLYRRLRARGWSKRKAWENVEAEILDVCLHDSNTIFGLRRVYEIDTTKKSAKRLYRESLNAVKLGKATQRGRVDWLARYDPVIMERGL